MQGLARFVDVRSFVTDLRLGDERASDEVARAGFIGDLAVVEARVKILGQGGVRVPEIVEALTGDAGFEHRAVRAELYGEQPDGRTIDPMDLAAMRERRTIPSVSLEQPALASPS
jgi:hypothetical protein